MEPGTQKKTPALFRLDPELNRKLGVYAASLGVFRSEIVTIALEDFFVYVERTRSKGPEAEAQQ